MISRVFFKIPAFLHSNVDKILRTGKYLNVIQQCEQGKTKKTFYKAERTRPRMLLNPFKKPSKDEIDFKHEDENEEDLRYFENPEDYNAPLEQAYAFASKTLLELLIKDRDLIGHLRSVKHYFLLDQGDFIVQFMDLCGDELCQRFVVFSKYRVSDMDGINFKELLWLHFWCQPLLNS